MYKFCYKTSIEFLSIIFSKNSAKILDCAITIGYRTTKKRCGRIIKVNLLIYRKPVFVKKRFEVLADVKEGSNTGTDRILNYVHTF